MKKFITLAFTLMNFSLFFQTYAQVDPTASQIADQVFGNKKSISFSFNVSDKDQINNDLTYILSIDNVSPLPDGGYKVIAYANKQQFIDFLSHNISYEVIVPDGAKVYNMATTVAQMATWDRYPTYSVYLQMLAQFESSYPTLCKLDTIMASTPNGHSILILKISDNVNTTENEPRFMYSSSIHGDELTGYILMLRLIDYLLTNYGNLTKVTNIVNNVEIWICPLANPDGTYASGDNTINASSSTRENSNGVDLNRNYADPRAGLHPDGNSWQPETQAFMNFSGLHTFNVSANFHGGAALINYPWDTWISSGNPNADDAWWVRVCRSYADTCHLVSPSYMTALDNGVTEGGDWYVITGGRQDYMNFFRYCREVTIELDVTKTTETQNLPTMWNYNYRSLLNLIQESIYGIRGIVTDSCTGQPIRGKVWISSYDQTNDSSQVYSSLPVGNYHKYIIAGTYNVTYSAPGYTSKTINSIVASNGAATVVNVVLSPALPSADFTADVTSTCTGIVNFTDLSTGGANSWTWNFGDGFGSSSQNPLHAYTVNGTYTVTLTVGNCKGTNIETKTAYIIVNLPAAPSTTSGSRCGTGVVNLLASGTGTLNWFDVITGGNIIYTGSSFNTPPISTTTTYYVESQTGASSVFGGKPDNSGAGGYFTSSNIHGLYFDCLQACTLVSFNVYAGASGNKTFSIPALSLSGTYPVVSGINNIVLNWAIPVGTNYLLQGPASPNLYRNGTSGGSNLGYPFDVGGMLTIQQSTAGSPNQLAYYYFFYNWEIAGTPCSSARVALTATINPLAIAGFSFVVNGLSVNFTNTSSDAVSYSWNFGDGQTSTQSDPSHTYSGNGTFNVMLIATNNCGNDTVMIPVSITTVGGTIQYNDAGTISIYPNPATNIVYLGYHAIAKSNCTVEVINMVGDVVQKENVIFIPGKNAIAINLGSVQKGVYFMKLLMENSSVVRKIIIE